MIILPQYLHAERMPHRPKMKNIFALLLSVLIVYGFSGCANTTDDRTADRVSSNEAEETTEKSPEEPAETPAGQALTIAHKVTFYVPSDWEDAGEPKNGHHRFELEGGTLSIYRFTSKSRVPDASVQWPDLVVLSEDTTMNNGAECIVTEGEYTSTKGRALKRKEAIISEKDYAVVLTYVAPEEIYDSSIFDSVFETLRVSD